MFGIIKEHTYITVMFPRMGVIDSRLVLTVTSKNNLINTHDKGSYRQSDFLYVGNDMPSYHHRAKLKRQLKKAFIRVHFILVLNHRYNINIFEIILYSKALAWLVTALMD